MVLAAGRGVRLRPYTDTIPKPLLPFCDVPIIELAIRRLVDLGIESIVLNAFHHADQVKEFAEGFAFQLKEEEGFRGEIHVSRETELLGTGGAIAAARRFFDGSRLLVVNSDVLYDFDMRELFRFHEEHRGGATVLLNEGEEFPNLRSTLTDSGGRVLEIGREGGRTDAKVFSGIYVLEPRCYRALPAAVCSVVDALLRPAVAQRQGVFGLARSFPWHDLGTWERYHWASMAALAGELDAGVERACPGTYCDEGYIGPEVTIGNGVVVESSVLCHGSVVQADVIDSVLLPGARVLVPTESSVVGPRGVLYAWRPFGPSFPSGH